MLQVARLAPRLLKDSSDLVRSFLLRQQNEDGGFKDRSGRSDLYYTVFAIDGLLALQSEPTKERIESYLQSFGDGEGLDFVHLCCLARCRAALAGLSSSSRVPSAIQDTKGLMANNHNILQRIESYRSRDGGFNSVAGSEHGTAYASFLGFGAYQDLQSGIHEPLGLVQCLKFLETRDGAWGNERHVKIGSTNATAAAVTLLRNLHLPINPAVATWLLAQSHPEGGFRAGPNAPISDLLSTATAVHALAGMETSIEKIKESCLDFVDSLWTNEGAFHGSWADDILDCEYTFYGLLALGHLSL